MTAPGEAPHPVSTPPAVGDPLPWPVRYARGLLWAQGAIWAALAAFAAYVGLVSLMVGALGFWQGCLILAGIAAVQTGAAGAAVMSFILASRLGRAVERARKTVVLAEIALTCLGLLMMISTSIPGGVPADLFGLAGGVGAGLSLAAVLALRRPSARRYFAAPAARPGETARADPPPPSGQGPASFRLHQPSGLAVHPA